MVKANIKKLDMRLIHYLVANTWCYVISIDLSVRLSIDITSYSFGIDIYLLLGWIKVLSAESY